MSDEFDKLTSGLGKNDDEESSYHTIMDMIEAHYSRFYPGHIMLKALLVAESDNGRRCLRFVTSERTTEWDTLGLMESVKHELASRAVVEKLIEPEMIEDDEDDERE